MREPAAATGLEPAASPESSTSAQPTCERACASRAVENAEHVATDVNRRRQGRVTARPGLISGGREYQSETAPGHSAPHSFRSRVLGTGERSVRRGASTGKVGLVLEHQRPCAQHALRPIVTWSRSVALTPTKLPCPIRTPRTPRHARPGNTSSSITEWWPIWLPLHSVTLAPTCSERLDGVVLENKAVLSRRETGKDGRAAAQIGGEPVSLGTRCGHLLGADGIDLGVAHRNEQAELIRRKLLRGGVLKRDEPAGRGIRSASDEAPSTVKPCDLSSRNRA